MNITDLSTKDKTKDFSRVVKRIQTDYNLSDKDAIIIERMLQSTVASKDEKIKSLSKTLRKANSNLELRHDKIVSALRQTINDHGPITKEWIHSAAKRILSRIAGL